LQLQQLSLRSVGRRQLDAYKRFPDANYRLKNVSSRRADTAQLASQLLSGRAVLCVVDHVLHGLPADTCFTALNQAICAQYFSSVAAAAAAPA